MFLIATYFYDFNTDQWTDGPELLENRHSHACGTIVDAIDESTQIVVASGGVNNPSTELWIVGSPKGWTYGPDMPVQTGGGAAVVGFDGTALIVAGGYSSYDTRYVSEIQKFTCKHLDCQWTVMEQELAVARDGLLAILLPDSMVTCT